MFQTTTYLAILTSRLTFSIFSFLLTINLLIAQNGTKICFESNQFHDQPTHEALEAFTQNYIKKHQTKATNRGKINIPIVVHVVYPTENENISEIQIQSQIDALNRDFNKANINIDRVHPDFQDRIAHVGFNFCLATIDPDGNSTNGITRTPTNNNLFVISEGNIYHSERGGKDAWNTTKYLNIWVTKMAPNFAGYGSKSGENPPDEDGVVLSVNYFGQSGTALPNYRLGRTGTHEVAHYFNIFHPWGNNCNHDDFVADTPTQSDAYNGCPNIDESSCGSRDITANFMNYSEDACLAMFTKGQALRMQAALIYARSGLLNGNACNQINTPITAHDIKIYPNPASYYFCIETGNSILEEIPYFIFNAQGAKVEEGVVLPNSLQHFPTYRNGVYFVHFMDGSKEGVIKKIVIN